MFKKKIFKGKKFFDKSLLVVDDGIKRLTLFGLAIPLFIENVGSTLIGLIQTALSSRFMGGFFVSPMNIVNNIVNPFILVTQIVSVGLGIILSINLGRKKYEECKQIIGTAIIVDTILMFIAYGAFLIFADELLSAMGYTDPSFAPQLPYAKQYMRLRVIPLLIGHLVASLLEALRCYGHTKVGLYTTIVSNIINVILTSIFLYGIVPAKEDVIHGFIVIQCITAIANVLLTIFFLIRHKISISFKFKFKWALKILKVGTPASVANLAYSVSTVLTTGIYARYVGSINRPELLDARIYVNQIVIFVHLLGFKIACANKIMVGRLCGMGELDRADRMCMQNLKMVAMINFAISLTVAFFGSLLVKGIFGASQAIVDATLIVFFIDVIVETGRGMNHIGQNSLNATGDVLFTTIVSIVAAFTFSVGLAYVFCTLCGFGMTGLWMAFAVDELCRATLYIIRWKKGRWKKSFQKEFEENQLALA